MDLKHHDVKYKRWIYLTVTFVIILAGLASRKYGNALPNYCRVYWRYTLGSYGLLGITLSLPFGIHTQSGRNLLTVFLLHRNQPIIPGRLGECHTKHHARSIGLRAWILWSDMICYTVGVMLSATVDSCASFSSSDEAV